MEIWKKLRELRTEKNLTYDQLYDDLNKEISVSTLKAYESKNKANRRKLSSRAVEILSSFYEVPKEYLLYEENDTKKKENIDISEILGLSDKTIEKISTLTKEELHIFNFFMEEIELTKFLSEYNLYIKESLFHDYMNKFQSLSRRIDLLNYYKEKNDIEGINKVLKYYYDILEQLKALSTNGTLFIYQEYSKLLSSVEKYYLSDDEMFDSHIFKAMNIISSRLNKDSIYHRYRSNIYLERLFYSQYSYNNYYEIEEELRKRLNDIEVIEEKLLLRTPKSRTRAKRKTSKKK